MTISLYLLENLVYLLIILVGIIFAVAICSMLFKGSYLFGAIMIIAAIICLVTDIFVVYPKVKGEPTYVDGVYTVVDITTNPSSKNNPSATYTTYALEGENGERQIIYLKSPEAKYVVGDVIECSFTYYENLALLGDVTATRDFTATIVNDDI